MNIEKVVKLFSEDAIYEDLKGVRHEGHVAIREAFESFLAGSRVKINFESEEFCWGWNESNSS